MPEKDAFITLVRIMEEYQMRDLYKPLMAQLGMVMYQFENMIKVNVCSNHRKILETIA